MTHKVGSLVHELQEKHGRRPHDGLPGLGAERHASASRSHTPKEGMDRMSRKELPPGRGRRARVFLHGAECNLNGALPLAHTMLARQAGKIASRRLCPWGGVMHGSRLSSSGADDLRKALEHRKTKLAQAERGNMEDMLAKLQPSGERTLAAAVDGSHHLALVEREAAAFAAATKTSVGEKVDWLLTALLAGGVATIGLLAMVMIPQKHSRDAEGVVLATRELRGCRRESTRALRTVAERMVIPVRGGRESVVAFVTQRRAADATVLLWAGGELGEGEVGSITAKWGNQDEDGSLWGQVHALLAERASNLRIVTVFRGGRHGQIPLRLAVEDVRRAAKASGVGRGDAVVLVGDGAGSWVGPLFAAGEVAGAAAAPSEQDEQDVFVEYPEGEKPHRAVAGPLGVKVAGLVAVCPRMRPLSGSGGAVAAAVALSRLPAAGPDALSVALESVLPPVHSSPQASADLARGSEYEWLSEMVAEERASTASELRQRVAKRQEEQNGLLTVLSQLVGEDSWLSTRTRGRSHVDGAIWHLQQQQPLLSPAESEACRTAMREGQFLVHTVLPAAASLPVWMTTSDAGNLHTQWVEGALELLTASSPASGLRWERGGESRRRLAVAEEGGEERSWLEHVQVWLGLGPFANTPAARSEMLLQQAARSATTAGDQRSRTTLVLGPDVVMNQVAAAGREKDWLERVGTVGQGASSLAREQGWVGAHSLPLQAPEAIVDAVMDVLAKPIAEGVEPVSDGGLRVWSP
jgi:hypothetical protein